jgi:hypothetical protein
MHLKVLRTTFTNRSTIGELYVDDAFECFTLEDMVRPVKVPGMTAIPEGVYVVSVSFSNRFRRPLPEIHNVPNYTGVRIHAGNTDADTEGCILVGKTKAKDFIGNSRAAFDKLFARIQQAAQREKIFMEVTSAASAARGLAAPAPALRGLVGVSPPPARVALVKPAAGRRPAATRAATAGKPAKTRKRAAVRKSAGVKRGPAAGRRSAATRAKPERKVGGARRR